MIQSQFNSNQKSQIKCSSRIVSQSQSSKQKLKLSTKYCLKKPKLMKEFQNSKLFQQTQYSTNLKPYTQRFTYNAKTKSFQKENTNFVQTRYDVDYSFIENLNKQNSIQIPKLLLLKKNSQKILHQRTEISAQRPNSTEKDFDEGFSQSKKNQKQQKLKNLLSIQRPIPTKISSKRINTYNRNFLQVFPNKDEKQNIKEYIRTNPINIVPIKLDTFKQKFNNMDSFRKSNKRKKTEKLEDRFAQSQSNGKFAKSVRFMEENDLKQGQLAIIKQQELFKSQQDAINRLYDSIFQLKSLGYAEEKVNEWVWTYCQNNKKFLQSIIFKTQGYRSSLAELKLIYKLQDIETSKNNAKRFKRTINNQQIPLQSQDISQLISYLEQLLISKQYFQLKRLQTQIQDTSYAIKNNYLEMKDEKVDDILKLITTFEDKKKLKPLEYYQTLNFYEDAKRLQTHFGKVKGLTNASKKKCQNLTDIEIDIIRKKK